MEKKLIPAWLVPHLKSADGPESLALIDRLVSRTLPDGSISRRFERDFASEVVKNGELYSVVVSDTTLDRYGDIVEADGCDFTNYAKNPVWLVDHDYRVQSIVGRGMNMRVDKKRVIVDFAPDLINSCPACDMVLAKLDSGSLRAVSIGFQPTKWEKILNDQNDWTGGFRYLKWELLENSWVAVPANPNALLSGASLSLPSPETSGHGDKTLDTTRQALTDSVLSLFATAHKRS